MDSSETGFFGQPNLKNSPVQGERKTPSGLPKNYTMPATVTGSIGGTALAKFPQLINGSAPELLDDHVRYSGWIRKQGGGYKNCKWDETQLLMCALHVTTIGLIKNCIPSTERRNSSLLSCTYTIYNMVLSL